MKRGYSFPAVSSAMPRPMWWGDGNQAGYWVLELRGQWRGRGICGVGGTGGECGVFGLGFWETDWKVRSTLVRVGEGVMAPFQGLGFLLGFTWGDAPGYHIWASLGPWMMARREMGGRVWERLWGKGRVRSLAVPGLFGASVIGERRAGAQRSQGRVVRGLARALRAQERAVILTAVQSLRLACSEGRKQGGCRVWAQRS
jgi:hypothetical protein